MKLIPLDIEKTSNEYKSFYNQTGRGMIPIFAGAKNQVGYGLGSIFGNLLKSALPVVKQGAKNLGKLALKTGLDIAQDKLSGKTLNNSFMDNINKAKREILSRKTNRITKSNKKRKNVSKKVSSKNTAKSKRRKLTNKDIFTK